jgi:hypothetical protein
MPNKKSAKNPSSVISLSAKKYATPEIIQLTPTRNRADQNQLPITTPKLLPKTPKATKTKLALLESNLLILSWNFLYHFADC